jgi:hypothetical protein
MNGFAKKDTNLKAISIIWFSENSSVPYAKDEKYVDAKPAVEFLNGFN